MKERKTIPVGALFMIIVLALASLGVGYGLWSKTLTITGEIETGDVHALFVDAFTDDDDFVDDTEKDSLDKDDCPDVGMVDDYSQPINQLKDGEDNGRTSCDPAASGRDPKPRLDKDVARCDARVDPEDSNKAEVKKSNVYPGYFCTAWFDFINDGSIPVKIQSVKINGESVWPSVTTPFDLDGDKLADVEIHVSEIKVCQQIEPNELVQMDIDQHVLQEAPQDATLGYTVEVQLNQWNEACRVLLYYGNGGFGPNDEPGPSTRLFDLKTLYEGMGFSVDYTDVWPDDLSIYQLVVLYGPGRDDDSGTHFFFDGQKDALKDYMELDKRVVVMGDHSGGFGVSTVNNLLNALGVGISQNADLATPDGDVCGPLNDLTADQVTAGITELDPSATSSLNVSGSAISLARVPALPYTCLGGVKNGATWMAIDRLYGNGGLVMIADTNILDDQYGFNDPQGDGMSGAALGTNLIMY
jgi:hypothetical protein